MTGVTAFVWHAGYLKYQFGPDHPFQPIREKYTLDMLRRLGVFDAKAKVVQPRPATRADLKLVHTAEYIDFVQQMSKRGIGYLDMGDTPATPELYTGACWAVGGSLCAADLIMEGGFLHTFNPAGGLHHARVDGAAGFCVFNDVAIAVRHLQKRHGLERIAVVDIDGHAGDGTQQIFYQEPILTISLHRYGLGFFPGTGAVDEVGEGEGEGYSVNVPLPLGTTHRAYLYAFRQIVPPLIRKYKPQILLSQFGVDGHYQDPLVGLALTTHTYRQVALTMHKLAHGVSNGKLLILGGGGYEPHNVARCWSVMFITVSQATLPDPRTYERILDKPQPVRADDVFAQVKETVSRVKQTIFPLHGLRV
jgi:acetoin utilization protein AcuC